MILQEINFDNAGEDFLDILEQLAAKPKYKKSLKKLVALSTLGKCEFYYFPRFFKRSEPLLVLGDLTTAPWAQLLTGGNIDIGSSKFFFDEDKKSKTKTPNKNHQKLKELLEPYGSLAGNIAIISKPLDKQFKWTSGKSWIRTEAGKKKLFLKARQKREMLREHQAPLHEMLAEFKDASKFQAICLGLNSDNPLDEVRLAEEAMNAIPPGASRKDAIELVLQLILDWRDWLKTEKKTPEKADETYVNLLEQRLQLEAQLPEPSKADDKKLAFLNRGRKSDYEKLVAARNVYSTIPVYEYALRLDALENLKADVEKWLSGADKVKESSAVYSANELLKFCDKQIAQVRNRLEAQQKVRKTMERIITETSQLLNYNISDSGGFKKQLDFVEQQLKTIKGFWVEVGKLPDGVLNRKEMDIIDMQELNLLGWKLKITDRKMQLDNALMNEIIKAAQDYGKAQTNSDRLRYAIVFQGHLKTALGRDLNPQQRDKLNEFQRGFAQKEEALRKETLQEKKQVFAFSIKKKAEALANPMADNLEVLTKLSAELLEEIRIFEQTNAYFSQETLNTEFGVDLATYRGYIARVEHIYSSFDSLLQWEKEYNEIKETYADDWVQQLSAIEEAESQLKAFKERFAAIF